MSIFALYPKTTTWIFTFAYRAMLGSENSELSSFELYFSHFFKFQVTVWEPNSAITQNFSKPTKAFNLENIVQACLVSFQTHRVNKDDSNSVKD